MWCCRWRGESGVGAPSVEAGKLQAPRVVRCGGDGAAGSWRWGVHGVAESKSCYPEDEHDVAADDSQPASDTEQLGMADG